MNRLVDFVRDWNMTHKRFTLALFFAPEVMNRPTSVEIRYPAARFQRILSSKNWEELNLMLGVRSRHNMYITTSEYLFMRGIIDVKIASQNHNYNDRYAIGALRWIGEELFGVNPDEDDGRPAL